MKFKITPPFESFLHFVFDAGLFFKIFGGIWETTAGTAVLFFGNTLFDQPGTRQFVALYLILHGVQNFYLAIELFRKRLWAYIVTIGVTLLFIIYQFYRIYLYDSAFLTFLTFGDIIFMYLTWHEYRHKVKAAQKQYELK